jgi:transposase
MLNNTIIGIDIAKAKFDVFATHHEKSYKHVFQNTPSGFNSFMEWMVKKHFENTHVCLEATGSYGERLSNFLFEKGLKVSVVNPARIKAYGRCNMTRHKTDEVDAKLIAHFCETQKPDLWSPPPKEEYELRELTRCLASLKSSRDDFSNRLEKLEHKGDVVSQHYLNIQSKIEEEIKAVSRAIDKLIISSPMLKNRHNLS